MVDVTDMVWVLEVAPMSVSKVNTFLVILLHFVSALAFFTGALFLLRGFYVQAAPTLFVGCILTVGLAARSIRLQDENDRFVGDFLDSISPTIQSGPPPVEAFRSTLPPVPRAPNLPRIVTWHGNRGKS